MNHAVMVISPSGYVLNVETHSWSNSMDVIYNLILSILTVLGVMTYATLQVILFQLLQNMGGTVKANNTVINLALWSLVVLTLSYIWCR